MKRPYLVSVFLLSVALVLCGCATAAPAPPPERTQAPPPPPKIEYERLGRPAPLGKSFAIAGPDAVWIQGEPLIITLEQTTWETMDDVRTGKAKLKFMHEGQDVVVTIAEGQTKQVHGYSVTVESAGEVYDKEQSNTVQTCKLVVAR